MERLFIANKIVSSLGSMPFTDRVLGATLTNIGDSNVNYSMNDESKNIILAPGESVPFGGIQGYVLGGNKMYYSFGSGTKPRLQITTFTIQQIPDNC